MSRKISLVVTFLLFIIALCQVDRLFQSKFGTDYPAKAYDLIFFSEPKRIYMYEDEVEDANKTFDERYEVWTMKRRKTAVSQPHKK